MQRRLMMGGLAAVAGVLIVGAAAWALSQGLIGPHGRAKHLLIVAQQAMRRHEWPSAQANLERLINTFPDSPVTAEGLLALGQVHEQQQQLVEGRAMYRVLLERFPDSSLAKDAQARLGALNVALQFSPTITDTDLAYAVAPGDTLAEIAAAHHTTIELLKRANGLTRDVIHPRQQLKVPKGTLTIVVDKSQNQLLVTENNQFFKAYTVATGANNSTPVGTFKIINKIANPVWYRQGAVVPPESPDNILGTRWMGWDKQGYGIHGSVDPSAMGHQVTAGCVRMTNADVEELFALVPMGTEVTVVD